MLALGLAVLVPSTSCPVSDSARPGHGQVSRKNSCQSWDKQESEKLKQDFVIPYT